MAKQKASSSAASAVEDVAAACAPEWTDILRQMIFIRRFEEATEREFRRGKIGGYLHAYIGQEAVASGIDSATPKGDIVHSGYPDPTDAVATGTQPAKVIAEVLGHGNGLWMSEGGGA